MEIFAMNFIFITRRPTPPLFLGGAEITHNYLAEKLAKRGHCVYFIGSLDDPNFPTTERYNYYYSTLKNNKFVNFVSQTPEEIIYEYKGIKCLVNSQSNLVSNFHNLLISMPNIAAIITSMEGCSEFIKIAKSKGIYTIGWLHSSNQEGLEALKGFPDLLLSTSEFIKQKSLKYSHCVNSVFYPAFDKLGYTPTAGKFLTFINPVKEKGADFILKLAQSLPEEHFICVEGWYKNKEFCSQMLSNMTYFPPQFNMDKIWKKTRILLVPSNVPEAFGRVIVEANLHGIPVIAHNVGGIPEAMNGAGILQNSLNIKDWIQSIKIIDNDKNAYKLKAITAAQKFTRDVVTEFLFLCGSFNSK